MPQDEAERLINRIKSLHKKLGGDKSASDEIMKRLEELAEEKKNN